MKSTVEHIGPTRVRFNVEVPFDELKPDFDRAYKKIAQQVRIPGFRPGKAPARVIDARLGRGVVLDEVINTVVPAKYDEAVSASAGVSPIGRPEFDLTEVADGDKVAFTAEVDVRPEITLPPLAELAVTVDTAEVTDEQVTEAIDELRARFGTLAGVDRPAADGDFVQIDLSAAVDGKPVEEASTTGFSYQVGQGGLVDGIDEAITGLAAGASATFTSKLVAGEYADQDAEITVKVTAVKQRELPEADDEFAQLASEFDTLDELTADQRGKLERLNRIRQVGEARSKVVDALVDAVEVPLPQSIVDGEIESRLHDAVHPFEHSEARFNEALERQGKSREEFDAETRTEAERAVKTRLVLDALADSEQVTVTEQEVTERIVFEAQRYGLPPEEFVRQLQQAGRLGAVFADIRTSKAALVAVRAATVTDEAGAVVDLDEFLGTADADEDEAPGGEIVDADEVDADEAAEAALENDAAAADAAADDAAEEAAEDAADDATEQAPAAPRPATTAPTEA